MTGINRKQKKTDRKVGFFRILVPEGDSKYPNKIMNLLVFSLVWFFVYSQIYSLMALLRALGSDDSSAAHTVNSRYFMPVFEGM